MSYFRDGERIRLDDGMEFASKREFAKWLGVSHDTANRRMKKGATADEVRARYRPKLPAGWGYA